MVPDDFTIPATLETNRMRLRMLTIQDAVKDFEAVMESKDYLLANFDSSSNWPEGLTLEQNIIELGWHQTEFQQRTSFAYTVAALDESTLLGCVYIYPTHHLEYDAEVTMWVRTSQMKTSLNMHLFNAIQSWMHSCWPFKNIKFPT